MNNLNYKQSLGLLHLVIFIWGFTGILGKVLTDTLSAEVLVWYRMFIGAVSIAVAVYFVHKTSWPSRSQLIKLFGVGLIIALHWITFFGSIKVSNVSIALACLSSSSLFTAILEPLIYRKKIQLYELLLGSVVIGALIMIFKFETSFQLGIILSVTSAFLASLFTTFNGKLVEKIDPIKVSLFEITGGWMWVSIYLLIFHKLDAQVFNLSLVEASALLILGTVCTGFAFIAGVAVMKKLSPFTVTLSINLEPIYSILLAFLFFNEYKYLTGTFYIGASLILATVVANAFIKAKMNRKSQATNTSLI